jgi:methylated-DNA-protein-cysteine methyltransferase-like protein
MARRRQVGHKLVTMRGRAKTSCVETPPFERVQALVRRIPRGKVATYGQLSRMIGGRLTPVGVGWAIRAAPEGSIPWQRVVNAKGGISTDGEHPGLQRAMLEAEGVRFRRDGSVDLDRHGWDPETLHTEA